MIMVWLTDGALSVLISHSLDSNLVMEETIAPSHFGKTKEERRQKESDGEQEVENRN